MTGCYANRVGLEGALNHTSRNGISSDEELLPELLQQSGYKTGMFGKWHLGSPELFNPLDHGFDTWFGLPYSNDNSKYHPVLADSMPPLPLYRDREVIELDPDQQQFTKRFTQEAIKFIVQSKDEPFFCYIPHVMPHVPIFASEEFQGKTGKGLYADVIAELDWSIGQINDCLKRNKLSENTLILITSDNGPFLSYGTHAGNASPLREGKLTSYEGGVRVPMIACWPGNIPSDSVCDSVITSMDLLPTLCCVAKAKLPSKSIDGRDIRSVLLKLAPSPHEAIYFYSGRELHAVRSSQWKLHVPHPFLTVFGETRSDGKPSGWGQTKAQSIEQSGVQGIASRHGYRVEQQPLALYDFENDPGETSNVAEANSQVVQDLMKFVERARADLGDSLTSIEGSNIRPAGTK